MTRAEATFKFNIIFLLLMPKGLNLCGFVAELKCTNIDKKKKKTFISYSENELLQEINSLNFDCYI